MVVLNDRLQIADVNMVAANGLLLRRFNFLNGKVSNISLLYVEEVQTIQVDDVTSLSGIERLDALELRTRGRNLEAVSCRTSTCHHTNLVGDAAVEA